MLIKSVLEIKQLFEKLCPEQTARATAISLFAESIEHAHKCAPDEWVVVFRSSRPEIRLTVGHLVTFAVEPQKLWISVDLKQLEMSPELMDILNQAQSWQWKTGRYEYFKLVPARNGYYFPDIDSSKELLPVIWSLNCAYVSRIGELKRKLRPWSRKAYQPAVIEFLSQEVGRQLPEPKTLSGDVPAEDLALPEEISDAETFYEGARKQISVNAYERNPGARKKCLDYHGYKCVVCDQRMSDIYGPAAEKVIHVHHLKPLNEIQETYQIDPIADLRPVCPNCHAVIHRRKPPYTIEEVRGFLGN